MSKRTPKFLSGCLIAVLATACGAAPQNKKVEQNEEVVEQTTTTPSMLIRAAEGGSLSSADQLFRVDIPPAALEADATLSIETVTAPLASAVLASTMYRAKLSPAVDINLAVSVVFELGSEAAQLAQNNGLIVGRRVDEQAYFHHLLFADYAAAASTATALTPGMGDFALIDLQRLLDCTCNTANTCQPSCEYCDLDCHNAATCETSEFGCGIGHCVPKTWECDDAVDCLDGSDEGDHCQVQCTASQWQCNNGDCVAATARCNNTADCADSSDESGCPTSAGDAYEDDDDFAHAKTITAGAAQSHSIHEAGDRDFVVFTLGAWADVTLETAGTSGDTVLYLYDASQSEIDYDDDDGTGSFSRLTHTQAAPGTYYAMARAYSSSATIPSYSLTLTVVATTPQLATPSIASATQTNGVINVAWSAVPNATSYSVYYDTDSSPPYSPTMTATEGASPITTSATTQTLSGLPHGTIYYVVVTAHAVNFADSAYSSSRSVTLPPDPDSFEPDDTLPTAHTISSGTPQTHTLHSASDVDVVVFTLSEVSNVVLETNGTTGDTQLELLAADGTLITSDDDSGTGYFSKITRTAQTAGTYYARVHGYSSTINAYTLSLTATTTPVPSAPTGMTITALSGSVTVHWNSVTGATGYRVYYDDDSSAPFNPAFVAAQGGSPLPTTSTSMTLSGLTAGQPIWVAVSALTGPLESPYSAIVSATPQ